MMPNADVVTLTLLALVAALALGIIGYALAAKAKARRNTRDNAVIRATIVEYFRRSGVEVSADCVKLADGCYTAIIESEPMKRFRLSHIIEMTLSEHVRKACGLELDKIYWRFPIKEVAQAQAAQAGIAPVATAAISGQAAAEPNGTAPKAANSADEYINEGLEHYRHIPQPEVTELSWETFEEMSTGGGQKKDPSA